MSFLLPLLMILILAACIGFLYPEGLWSNAIRLVNVVTSGLIAMNFWEPLARWFESFGDFFASCTYFWDFIALWALFIASMVVMQVLTKLVSRVKVRFLKIVDQVGGGILAACVGWVMVCFIVATLHTAPLPPVWGGFDPAERMVFGLAPDRQWLGFVQHVSRGALAWPEPQVFDPEHQFPGKYYNRRAALEQSRTEKKAFRVASGEAPKR